MRRWLAILMLVLLPLQSSWAAAAAYCGYEADQDAQHLGHHEHQCAGHASAGQGGETTDQGESSGFDFDCGHCHCTCAGMPALHGAMASLTPASHAITLIDGVVRTLPQSPPERPQWLPLA